MVSADLFPDRLIITSIQVSNNHHHHHHHRRRRRRRRRRWRLTYFYSHW